MKFSFSCVYSFFKCSFRSFFFQVSIQQDIRVWDWRERCLRPAETVWHGQWGTQVCPLTQFLFAWFLFGRGSPLSFLSVLPCLSSVSDPWTRLVPCFRNWRYTRTPSALRLRRGMEVPGQNDATVQTLITCDQTWVTQILANWECGRRSQIRLEGSSEWHQEELSVQHSK